MSFLVKLESLRKPGESDRQFERRLGLGNGRLGQWRIREQADLPPSIKLGTLLMIANNVGKSVAWFLDETPFHRQETSKAG